MQISLSEKWKRSLTLGSQIITANIFNQAIAVLIYPSNLLHLPDGEFED